jgi:hypothetical protein
MISFHHLDGHSVFLSKFTDYKLLYAFSQIDVTELQAVDCHVHSISVSEQREVWVSQEGCSLVLSSKDSVL